MSLYKRFAVCAFMFEFVTPPTINKSSNEYIYELFEVRDAGDMGKGVFATYDITEDMFGLLLPYGGVVINERQCINVSKTTRLCY
jgi:hypothetical protein